jgi:hypothetical protein
MTAISTYHRTYFGRVVYIGDGDGRGPVERGRESFTVSVHGNGHRTIQARCEIDDSAVLRHVHYTVDANWRPLDAHIRLDVGGQFMGSGWFDWAADGSATCETKMAAGGRVSQRIGATAGEEGFGAVSFGAHPVACDVWHLGAHLNLSAHERQPGQVRPHRAWMSSLLPNGASGPLLSTMQFGVEDLGTETLTVPAGTFETRHVRYIFDDGHPDEHIWCTTDDLILVQLRWDLLRTTYQLVELSR